MRVRRRDAAGQFHGISRTFPYAADMPAHSELSRAAVFKQAAAWAAQERAALHVEKRPDADRLAMQTLGGWLERYEDEICPGKKGGSKEQSICRLLRERFPKLCARAVTELRAPDFGGTGRSSVVAVLRDEYGLAPATIVRHLAVLSHVFTTALQEWDYNIPNPVQAAKRPALNNARERTVSPAEWRGILGELRQAQPATIAAIRFLRWTACRRGEVVNLLWEHIDLNKKTAMLLDTKSPKAGKIESREIPLPAEALAALRACYTGKKPPASGPVFSVDGNKPLAGDTITQAWERACERAKIEDAVLHDLRHTRTTELAALLPMQKVMRITGHSDPRTMLRYYNPTAEDLGRELEEAETARTQAAGKKAKAARARNKLDE